MKLSIARGGSHTLLFLLACLASAWALVVAVTGGFAFTVGTLRLSSRDSTRPLIVGVVALLAYLALSFRHRSASQKDPSSHTLERRACQIAALAVSGIVLFVGIHWGAFVAGGSDSYGYLSEADLWLSHRVHIEQPWVQQMPWPDADWTFTPLAYRVGATPHSIVPTVPPGFPLLLAGSQLMLGPKGAPLVVPVLGALLIWITFLSGRDATGDEAAGALAAAIVATTPVFLYQVMSAMSDVPAVAFWSLSFWFGFVRHKRWPLAAGLAAAAAILIRPNLALLACVPAVAWLERQRRDRTPPTELWSAVVWFGLGVSPGPLLIAVANAYLYGAPWISGYGAFNTLYSFTNIGTNIRHYVRWSYEAEALTFPLGLLLLALPLNLYRDANDAASLRWGFMAAVALTIVSYIFYMPFENWTFLRFLLPALPICAVVVASAAVRICRGVPPPKRAVAAAILCLPLVANGVKFSRERGVFALRSFEGRFVEAARQVETLTPPNAIILAQMHSGSVRYYAHRITLRYDVLRQEWLDKALQAIVDGGYGPYILLDDLEERGFRDRFQSTSAGKLDWAPLADIPGTVSVRLYSGTPRTRP